MMCDHSAYYWAFKKQHEVRRLAVIPPLESHGVKLENQVKPSRAHVDIEELDGNLLSGVRICSLEGSSKAHKEPKPPAWPCVFYTHINESNWLSENTFTMVLDSYVKEDEDPKIIVKDVKKKSIKPERIWLPFTCQAIENITLSEAGVGDKGKKYRKVTQRFTVKLRPPEDEKKPYVPYVQFYCGHECKHSGGMFKEENIITIVIKHPKYPLHWPSPPIITVVPTAEQTFIPMLPKQKMVLVTSKIDQIVDFKAHASSTIKPDGDIVTEHDKQCSYFNCTKPSPTSEIIFINQKTTVMNKRKKGSKKVVIPFCEKEVRFPVILNPLRDAVIYSQNIDGFILRFWKESYLPVTILAGTPIRGVHTQENTQYFERRFEVEKRRPFFYLQKKDHSWVIH